jgi:hypothetical protein
MSFVLKTWHLFLLVTSAAMQRGNEKALEMALDQLRMYKERYGRIRLTDTERRVLAVKGKALDRSNHQSFDNTILQPGPEVGQTTGDVECRERLGGLLNYYYRRAD